MHLVNDYLHFELKHSNSQPTHAVNIITLVLLTVKWYWFIQLHLKCKKTYYWLIIIAPCICVQRVSQNEKREKTTGMFQKTTREHNMFYSLIFTDHVSSTSKMKGWKCIVKTHKMLMVICIRERENKTLFNQSKDMRSKAMPAWLTA